ncbi:hypothetical protein EES42_43930 [Streptomyces sp. ADI95-17]|nr:hypothetical protein EES42_43930 [Streptomyces sp. ADI95-17]
MSVHGRPGAGSGEAFLERDVLMRPHHPQPVELFHPPRIQTPHFLGFPLVGEPGPQREPGRHPVIRGDVVVRHPQLLRPGLLQIPHARLDTAPPERVLGLDDPQLHEPCQQRRIPGRAELQQLPRGHTRPLLTRRHFPLSLHLAFLGTFRVPTPAPDTGIREVFDGVGVVCPQRPEDLREGAVGIRGQHFVRCFARRKEYRNDQRSNLPFTGLDSQGSSDHLHDIDHRPPYIAECDGITIRGIDALAQHLHRAEHPQRRRHQPLPRPLPILAAPATPAASAIPAAPPDATLDQLRLVLVLVRDDVGGELLQDGAPVGGWVLAVQPVRPYPLRLWVASRIVFPELPGRVDDACGHGFGFADPAVERQDLAQVFLGGRGHDPGLQCGEPCSACGVRPVPGFLAQLMELGIGNIYAHHLIRRHQPAAHRL